MINNLPIVACVVARPPDPDMIRVWMPPIGTILYRVGSVDALGRPRPSDVNCMRGTVDCDGSSYRVEDYPQLYEVIGDNYCPKTIYRYDRAPWWRRLLGTPYIPIAIPNPDYRPGMFRVPDLRNTVREQYANDLHRPESGDRGRVEEGEPLHRRLLW